MLSVGHNQPSDEKIAAYSRQRNYNIIPIIVSGPNSPTSYQECHKTRNQFRWFVQNRYPG